MPEISRFFGWNFTKKKFWRIGILLLLGSQLTKFLPCDDERRKNMDHLLINVVDFKIVGPYTLRVIFDDEQERIINFESVLYGHYYGPLRDLELFDRVRLDSEVHALVWPNDADFDPATLYNWNRGEGEELAKRAARWQ